MPDGCIVRPVFARQREAIPRVRCIVRFHPRDDFLQLVEPVLLKRLLQLLAHVDLVLLLLQIRLRLRFVLIELDLQLIEDVLGV